MQANPVREAIGRGEVQYGTWVNMVRNPAILTLLKGAGLDFARIDMEPANGDFAWAIWRMRFYNTQTSVS